MTDIEKSIQYKLDEISERENIRILHCVESGSRAWGFASPDSDYDVRFIYVRRKEDYLRLDSVRDVIEWQLDDVYDINGWDVQKMLRLLKKSNPTVFEWNISPIVYRTSAEWNDIIRPVISEYFDPKSDMYHYLSMAHTNQKAYLTDKKVKLKKYFYVLRPLLAAKWVSDKGTPPPMLFSELMAAEVEKEIVPEINKLLELKMATSEMGIGEHIPAIDEYIADLTQKLEEVVKLMSAEKCSDWDRLNKVFYSLI